MIRKHKKTYNTIYLLRSTKKSKKTKKYKIIVKLPISYVLYINLLSRRLKISHSKGFIEIIRNGLDKIKN